MWQDTKRIFLNSAENLLQATARLLPSVLAMFLFVALSAVLAVALQALVRRLCDRFALDRRLQERGIWPAMGDSQSSPTRLLTRVSFWTVLALGVLLGLSVLEAPMANAISIRLLAYVPRLLVGLAILAVALGVARAVERNVLIGAVNMGMQSARLLALGARWLVILIGAAIALDQIGVGAGVVPVAFGILFGGIVLALALAVGLGAKDLVAKSLERRFRDGGAPESATEREETRGQIHHL